MIIRVLSSCIVFYYCVARGTPFLACSMVCNGRWHLLGNPKLVWHPARLIKEWGCVDLSVDTMHLKDPLILFRFEGSALSLSLFLPLFRFSHRINILGHYPTMTKDHFSEKSLMALNSLCVPMGLNKPSFIHSLIFLICS